MNKYLKPPEGSVQLNFHNLCHLDNGSLQRVVDHNLRLICKDIEDRPADKSERTVTLVISAKPKLDRTMAVLQHVDYSFQVASKLPSRKTDPFPMLCGGDGRVYFQPRSPVDPYQIPLEPDKEGAPKPEEQAEAKPDQPPAGM